MNNESLQPFEIQREALAERLNLREQWESQVKILNETGILEILPEAQELGIIGIDGREHPVPDFQEIMSRISPEQMEVLEKKNEQGFNKMVLVPFAVPLDILIDRYKKLLIEKDAEGSLSSTDGSKLNLDRDQPIYVWDKYTGADASGELVYFPNTFDQQNHGGKTKNTLIQEGKSWQFELLEENINIPAKGQGEILDGRKQLEAGQSPNQYLKELQIDPQYQNEVGLTPEAWLVLAITQLKENHGQIDDYQGQGKINFLTGAYFPGSDSVPRARWSRDGRRAFLDRSVPSGSLSSIGCRSSVEIQ